MASVRLKKEHKVEMHNRVLEDAAKERTEQLMNRENQVARAIYLHVIKGHGAAIQGVPSGFFQTSDDIKVKLFKKAADIKADRNGTEYKRATLKEGYNDDYNTVNLGYYNSGERMEIGEEVRMPHLHIHSSVCLLETSDLGQEVKALMKEQELLSENLTKLSETVKAALLECTTVKKLVENYPELKPYAPADIANQALAVAHGRIETLITCTKKATCKEEPKRRAKKATGVIAL